MTPALEHLGGLIGDVIRPAQCRRGYSTLILALALQQLCGLGLARVQITRASDKLGSARIIEKNGGVLGAQVISKRSGQLISQYQIDL